MAEDMPTRPGAVSGRRVAVLMESDFFEPEIFYYQRRFAEEGAEVHLITRLWGQPQLTFTGHEWRVPITVDRDLDMDDGTLRSYAALIVPGGMVADRLRYTGDVDRRSPATDLVVRALAEPGLVTGIICHGMWLMAAAPEAVRGRLVVVHNNLAADARNMGAVYVDRDVVVDERLVTGRTAHHCHLFARTIIDAIAVPGPAVAAAAAVHA